MRKSKRTRAELKNQVAAGERGLTPCDATLERKMAKAEEIVTRYRNTLRALSK